MSSERDGVFLGRLETGAAGAAGAGGAGGDNSRGRGRGRAGGGGGGDGGDILLRRCIVPQHRRADGLAKFVHRPKRRLGLVVEVHRGEPDEGAEHSVLLPTVVPFTQEGQLPIAAGGGQLLAAFLAPEGFLFRQSYQHVLTFSPPVIHEREKKKKEREGKKRRRQKKKKKKRRRRRRRRKKEGRRRGRAGLEKKKSQRSV